MIFSGTDDIQSPHGIPTDLLDRLLIIKTVPYNAQEITEILRIRSQAEEVDLSPEALQLVSELGVKRSLRYPSI